ncbi:WYL domain-containing protein [Hyphococcus sp.]|uniref:WYL domain-containing protein n=1 Tax=Hyphococcus sp. TaxID=2038636 RepID=UPI0035C72247
MPPKSTDEAWSVEQRLEFIEFRLFWEGTIRRSEIREKFGVSIQQASADIAKYRESAPENIRYDTSEKRYLTESRFKPIFYEPNPERYLAQLRAIEEGVISPKETMMGGIPVCDVIPIPKRDVSAFKLQKILQAIRTKQSISIEYQSMNDARPDPMWREITPHALATDGMRWHVRAHCHIQHKFKDFIISRCLRVGKLGDPMAHSSDDNEWNSFFDVVLVPNPHFSEAQKKTIERDYGMSDGRCIVSVRHALLYYFDKRLRLDVAESVDRPKETPIVVDNRNEYDTLLEELKT